ncbi:hypothetical protein GCK32_019836 [Trichostrongylus colubriformis]|uniref:Uncharacterized protein n=1 Tax=Trichostrongylus colubriformis TaxID=6319 RepID=A0AAN8EX12_TRICO
MGARCCSATTTLDKRLDADSHARRSASQGNRASDARGAGVRERREEVPLVSDQLRSRSEWDCHGPSKESENLERRQIEYRYRSETRVDSDQSQKREQLEQWLLQQPLSARKLDQSDRKAAMLSGTNCVFCTKSLRRDASLPCVVC